MSNFDQHCDLTITLEKAVLRIRSTIRQEMQALSKQDILNKLESAGVIHGVNHKLIDEILSKKLYDKDHPIALGTPVQHGQDAFIEEMIKIDPNIRPKLKGNGAVDFKNTENLPQAHVGDVILLKHAKTQGIHGINIFGQVIESRQSTDNVALSGGENTKITEDGLKLIAVKTGFLYRDEASHVSIGVTFTIDGDVNVKTGNIDYLGDVHVTGDVVDDFIVKAGGDITIDGTVGACELTAGGNIIIKQGVFGRGVAKIMAKRNITLPLCREASLVCGRTLQVEIGLNNCQVLTNDLIANHPHCVVSGCQITAYRLVDIAISGSELNQMQMRIVDRATESYEKKLADLEAQLFTSEKEILAIQTRLMALRLKHGHVQDANIKYDTDKLNKNLEQTRKLIVTLKSERTQLMNNYSRPCTFIGKVILREKIHDGVTLDMYRVEQVLTDSNLNKTITWKMRAGSESDEERRETIPPGYLVMSPIPSEEAERTKTSLPHPDDPAHAP